MTRGQLIKHCYYSLMNNRYMIVRTQFGVTGLNPNFGAIIDKTYLDRNKEIIVESVVKFCGINEYISHKIKNSFLNEKEIEY